MNPTALPDTLQARLTDHSWPTLERIVEDFKTLIMDTVIPNGTPIVPVAMVVMRVSPDNSPLPDPYLGMVIMDPRNYAASFALLRQQAQTYGASGVVYLQEVARVARFGPADPPPIDDVLEDPTRQQAIMISAQHESGEMVMWNTVHLYDVEYSPWEEVSDDAMVPGYMCDLVRTSN